MAKGNCWTCGEEIEVQLCCNSSDCGCLGLPIDPPFCSEECYENYKTKKEEERVKGINSI